MAPPFSRFLFDHSPIMYGSNENGFAIFMLYARTPRAILWFF